MVVRNLEPDQDPSRWGAYVLGYEEVFEPFSLQFAEAAIGDLDVAPGARVVDVGAGPGGAALHLARSGLNVSAVDASEEMVVRIRQRAAAAGLAIDARVMDGQALMFPDGAFDAALSVFGIILFPDPVQGLREMRRTVRPGGRVAIVTWTEPQAYELAVELRGAAEDVLGPRPAAALPAQLRYRNAEDCRALFENAGFPELKLRVSTSRLAAASARTLADNIAFAPGMAAMVNGLGGAAAEVLDRFVARVEGKQGKGRVMFAGKAFIACATV